MKIPAYKKVTEGSTGKLNVLSHQYLRRKQHEKKRGAHQSRLYDYNWS